MIAANRFVYWMNAVRLHTGEQQYRILESFWESQITSKIWLINAIKSLNIPFDSVYIFGGWFGVLGGLLLDQYNVNVYSIDIDKEVANIGQQMNPDVVFFTSDMKDFLYPTTPNLIINTSTEHITQETYNQWLQNIPTGALVILQGNDLYSCVEHIRCTKSLEEFNEHNPLNRILYTGSLNCKTFTRWMTIGYK